MTLLRTVDADEIILHRLFFALKPSPDAVPGSTESRHEGEPISHSKEAVCSASKFGTSSGSLIRAKEIRRGARVDGAEAVEREAAKWRPSPRSPLSDRAHTKRPATECLRFHAWFSLGSVREVSANEQHSAKRAICQAGTARLASKKPGRCRSRMPAATVHVK